MDQLRRNKNSILKGGDNIKPIIHFQLPLTNNGNISIPADTVGKFMMFIKNQLAEKYTLLVSPMYIQGINCGEEIVNVQVTELSFEKFIENFISTGD